MQQHFSSDSISPKNANPSNQNLCRQFHICIYKLYEWVIYSKLLVLLVFLFLSWRKSWPDGPHNGVLIPLLWWMEEMIAGCPFSQRSQASICWEWPQFILIVQLDIEFIQLFREAPHQFQCLTSFQFYVTI
jgi:hypothetical protein